jgi:two-component system, NtrC family, sensor histidine kinase PilS
MQAFEVVTQTGLASVAQRVLRLLALYRVVAAIGGFALVLGETGALHARFGLLIFIGTYALLYAVAIRFTPQVWKRPRLWLSLAVFVDVVFVLIISIFAGSLLFATALVPILVAHGWLLRDRFALAQAALVALALLTLSFLEMAPYTQTAFAGIGGFAAAGLGLLLGRVGIEAMKLADQRGEDLEKLSALNQRIIDDLDQGVLVVDRDGNILQANPQAEAWIFASRDGVSYPQYLMSAAQPLAVQWANWKEGHPMLDGIGITLGEGESQVKVRARFVSAELRRAGDAVVFLDDLAAAQMRAQQMKLAALGRLTANIAHEIRNPLSAIRQASQLLSETREEGDKRLLEMVEKNVRRIDRIVVNVLSLSKRDKVVPHAIALQTALPEIIAEWREQAQVGENSVNFTLENDGFAPQVLADRGHLEEIVWNLLGNGWRHSHQQPGSLTVVARRSLSGRMSIIEITDDGPGVASDNRESIFEPFFSLSGSSGLGLYISRELAEANAGSLELTPHYPGAQFRLLLPSTISETSMQ